jgi:hypothetical protein
MITFECDKRYVLADIGQMYGGEYNARQKVRNLDRIHYYHPRDMLPRRLRSNRLMEDK